MARALLVPVGWLLAIGIAAWLSGRSSGDAEAGPVVLLVAGAACSLAAGLALPRRLAAAYGLAAACVVGLLVVAAADGLSGEPLAGPLGYGNANGALCAQGAAAAMIPVLVSRALSVRVLATAVAAVLVGLAAATGSAAGVLAATACVLVPLALLLVRARHGPRTCRLVVSLAGVMTATALLVTVSLAASYDPAAPRADGVARVVDVTLSERRVALWSEAVALLEQQPVGGVGAGRFDETSRTALADEDARWAHSGFLQLGAETGLPGLISLLGLTCWLFLALWRACSDGRLAGLGACAAGAVLAHATIDYVLHFPVVPLLALATVGVCLRSVPRAEEVGA